jgi:tetratricopeptide (TPR) repeat protein
MPRLFWVVASPARRAFRAHGRDYSGSRPNRAARAGIFLQGFAKGGNGLLEPRRPALPLAETPGQEAFEAAVEAYRDALSLRPNLAIMGAALENLGRLKEAIDSYRTAVNSIRSFSRFAYGSITNGARSAIGMESKPRKTSFAL